MVCVREARHIILKMRLPKTDLISVLCRVLTDSLAPSRSTKGLGGDGWWGGPKAIHARKIPCCMTIDSIGPLASQFPVFFSGTIEDAVSTAHHPVPTAFADIRLIEHALCQGSGNSPPLAAHDVFGGTGFLDIDDCA